MLLFVGQKFGFQCFVLGFRLPAGPGACQREGVEHAVFQLHQGFRRCPGHLHVGAGEVEHVGRRVGGPEHPVGVKEASLKGGGEAVGEDDLENVSLADILLCFFHHPTVGVPVEKRRHLAGQMAAGLLFLLPVPEEGGHLLKLHHRPVVAGLRFVQTHVGDEDDFLAEVIECDDLVEARQAKLKSGQALDLGAIGKGIACDEAKRILDDTHLSGAVISVGGSLLLWGSRPGGGDWKVGVRDPRGKTSDQLGVFTLAEGFVSTSGDYERTLTADGKTYHHILDPKTGYPADYRQNFPSGNISMK